MGIWSMHVKHRVMLAHPHTTRTHKSHYFQLLSLTLDSKLACSSEGGAVCIQAVRQRPESLEDEFPIVKAESRSRSLDCKCGARGEGSREAVQGRDCPTRFQPLTNEGLGKNSASGVGFADAALGGMPCE